MLRGFAALSLELVMVRALFASAFLCLLGIALEHSALAAEPGLKVLFLGDKGHHQPAERFAILQPALAKRGIELTYSDKMGDLNDETLAKYDALVIYANTEKIEPQQEQALLDYVESGKGFVPLHCASFCFLNSPKYIALVGAQFQKHGTGVFRTTLAETSHPLVKGYQGFESWDETYVHTKHNERDRTILEYRVDDQAREPWTWVRTQGKGRVFYTAWGHDARTWSHPGFQNLVERGIRWAAGRDPQAVPDFADKPEMTAKQKDVKPFEYVEANLPNYVSGHKLGDALNKMQKPLPAKESVKHFITPKGITPQLVVAEPQIGKPLAMTWDERGRLWLAETVDYPNELQPEGRGRDRIRICEDTDGDGRADKFIVFAEKLSIPTSLLHARGGLIVHQAPHTLFLKDTNGDDVADERTILFTGWGTGDTHAGPSNLAYGPDNWIYGIVGYSGFRGTVGGEELRFSQGFYRFKPDGSKLEFLRSTSNNSWGIGFSEEGYLFGSTANGNPSMYLPIPNRYYEQVRGWSSSVLGMIAESNKFEPVTEKVRQVDHHGGFTAAAGHALYTARTWPKEYWNRTAFVAEPTGHLVATFVLSPQAGADFRSKNSWNALASDDEWSAPTMAEVGPDGNLWIIDWYNIIVQHNPTPTGYKTGKGNAYETDLRDKTHGRVYRLAYDGASPENVKPLNLHEASPEQLVAALAHPNLLWRRHAQRLLVERGKQDVVPALLALIADTKADEIGLHVGAMHSLWTLHGLEAVEKSLNEVAAALKHPATNVRRAALMTLPRTAAGTDAVLAAKCLHDTDDQVRLAAYLALAEMPPGEKAAAAIATSLSRLELPRDRWLVDAATAACARHDLALLRELAKSSAKTPIQGATAALLPLLAEHFARGGDPEALQSLLGAVGEASAEFNSHLFAGFAKGWPKAKPAQLNAEAQEQLVALLAKLPPAGKSQLIALATRWQVSALEKYSKEVAASLQQQMENDEADESARIAAARQLMEFLPQDMEIATAVLDKIRPKTSPALVQGFLDAIALSQADEVGGELVRRFRTFTPAARSAAIRGLLARSNWTPALLESLDKGTIPLGELTLDQKQALSAHPDRRLADRARKLLARGGALPDPDRQKVIDQFLPLLKDKADPVAGKLVFKQQCAKCHTHSGEGTKIGPDLTGMAVHPKHELLLHILDPSRSVEGNFRVYTLRTEEGQTLTGLLASETKTALELFDAEGKKHTIQRDEVEQLVVSNKSLMPEGFEKQVPPEAILNVLEFLTQRGKFLPIPLDKIATIVSTRGMFYSETAGAERLVFSDWSPKTFQGVPFQLVDPQGEKVPNVILLNGPNGKFPPTMPRQVTLPCNAPAKAIHFLSGVGGWSYPATREGTTSLIVRLVYEDGKTEDHPLKNGVEFADYIRRVDVPGSKHAFDLRSQQIRYFAILPQRGETIQKIELIKGPDATAPIVMAVTVETRTAE